MAFVRLGIGGKNKFWGAAIFGVGQLSPDFPVTICLVYDSATLASAY